MITTSHLCLMPPIMWGKQYKTRIYYTTKHTLGYIVNAQLAISKHHFIFLHLFSPIVKCRTYFAWKRIRHQQNKNFNFMAEFSCNQSYFVLVFLFLLNVQPYKMFWFSFNLVHIFWSLRTTISGLIN